MHRALFDNPKAPAHLLAGIAKRLSETERNSSDAERDSKDVKLFAYLNTQLKSGQLENYPSLVIDVRNFGFFVDVPALGMSGLVHLSSVEDDFYIFEAARNQLVGRRTRRVIRLGDQVTVQVNKVDTFKKQVDFRLTRPLPKARPIRGARTKCGIRRGAAHRRCHEEMADCFPGSVRRRARFRRDSLRGGSR